MIVVMVVKVFFAAEKGQGMSKLSRGQLHKVKSNKKGAEAPFNISTGLISNLRPLISNLKC
jgi:hypothetical protein